MRLKGRVAIITGASRGIGAAVAAGFAREGARVVINYRQSQSLAGEVVDRIRAAGGQAVAAQGDVGQRDDVARLIQVAHEQFGSVDILVNNAAYSPRSPWYEIDEATWDRVTAVNLKGALLCTQAVYRDMQAKQYGKVINVSSVTVELGWGPYVHYVTTKAGLIGFTRSLAREVGRQGIRVNCVMPGAIRTEQELRDFPNQTELAAFLTERQCLPQRGVPEDLVGTFVYLASNESDFVTGQVIAVDGGWIHY